MFELLTKTLIFAAKCQILAFLELNNVERKNHMPLAKGNMTGTCPRKILWPVNF